MKHILIILILTSLRFYDSFAQGIEFSDTLNICGAIVTVVAKSEHNDCYFFVQDAGGKMLIPREFVWKLDKKEILTAGYALKMKKLTGLYTCKNQQDYISRFDFFQRHFPEDAADRLTSPPTSEHKCDIFLTKSDSLILLKNSSGTYSVSEINDAGPTLDLLYFDSATRSYVFNEPNVNATDLVKSDLNTLIFIINQLDIRYRPKVLLIPDKDDYKLQLYYNKGRAQTTTISISRRIGDKFKQKEKTILPTNDPKVSVEGWEIVDAVDSTTISGCR